MDPLTLFALANGAVAAVKKGCQLYKEIQSVSGDVKGILTDLEKQFNNKFKDRAPTISEKNQYIEEKNRIINLNKQSGDTSSIYTQIGEQLGVYFDNLYKCNAVFEEEERRSKTEVYHGNDSIGRRALQRVLLKKQLTAMGEELREIMVYQSPPELGALWTEVEAMMKIVGKEQAGAVALQMQRESVAKRKQQKRIRKIKYRIACWSLTTLGVIYLIWLIWATVQIRIEHSPELGRCLIPKGNWGYDFYNNLKWIDCEIQDEKKGS